MKCSEFVFIMILIIVFFKFNVGYEKKHDGESILNESRVKKSLHTFSSIDLITRFVEDILMI